ncbi:hypothetical protein EBME_1979 [bacterium endosymbiont of Mortierella elongata FMR23-6]|nr:hypothetical protein EBME_1979 [bacterium endosymbiont of Mortierella elongata FMR23-6]
MIQDNLIVNEDNYPILDGSAGSQKKALFAYLTSGAGLLVATY